VTISIRHVTDLDEDWEKIRTLVVALENHHSKILGGAEHPIDTPYDKMRTRFVRAIGRDRARILLAETEDGEAIGMACAVVLNNPNITGKLARFSNFYVDDAYRGSPTVFRFHRLMEDWCRSKGVTLIQRTVIIANDRTRRLWHHLGFEPHSETLMKRLR
jgi:hypothetical protein